MCIRDSLDSLQTQKPLGVAALQVRPFWILLAGPMDAVFLTKTAPQTHNVYKSGADLCPGRSPGIVGAPASPDPPEIVSHRNVLSSLLVVSPTLPLLLRSSSVGYLERSWGTQLFRGTVKWSAR